MHIYFQRLDLSIDSRYKHRYIKALIKLSRNNKLYPSSLDIEEIEVEAWPFAGGGCGDIHKGRLRGQQVVVKLLRVYQTSDMEVLHKVIHNVCSYHQCN